VTTRLTRSAFGAASSRGAVDELERTSQRIETEALRSAGDQPRIGSREGVELRLPAPTSDD
jgi:hypothetical protein